MSFPRRVGHFARELAAAAADLLWPPHCAACSRSLASLGPRRLPDLCPGCEEGLTGFPDGACGRCARPLPPFAPEGPDSRFCSACRTERFAFRGAVAAGVYEREDAPGQPPLRELIHKLKYGARIDISRTLGMLLAARLAENPHLAAAELVVPVPLHAERLRERTFNQAEFLAVHAARALSRPLMPKLLRRTVATPAQAGQSRAERWRSIAGAFKATDRTKLEGKVVLLVDDVMTTGATADAAARALREGGAKEVWVAVVGRAL